MAVDFVFDIQNFIARVSTDPTDLATALLSSSASQEASQLQRDQVSNNNLILERVIEDPTTSLEIRREKPDTMGGPASTPAKKMAGMSKTKDPIAMETLALGACELPPEI